MDFISCVLRNFRCSDYSNPIQINNKDKSIFYLLYQDYELLNIANSYMYANLYGVESLSYLQDHFICYKKNQNSIYNKMERRVIVNNIFSECQLFSSSLWFIKDNAVTPYIASICSDSNIEPEMLRRNVYYTNSLGNYDTVEFSHEELNEVMKWYSILEEFLFKKKSDSIDMSNNLNNMSNYISFNIPSFQRAFYYLDNARRSDFLPAKIASYISILETIFAANGENTQKVAERTAYFIGESIDERISIYYDVKSIYDIRSCYVHGSLISDKKHQIIPEISEKADNLVRRVLKKAYNEYPQLNYMNKKDKNNHNSMNNIEVDRWFNELILRKE